MRTGTAMTYNRTAVCYHCMLCFNDLVQLVCSIYICAHYI